MIMLFVSLAPFYSSLKLGLYSALDISTSALSIQSLYVYLVIGYLRSNFFHSHKPQVTDIGDVFSFAYVTKCVGLS